jgi:hypothetical protein
MDLSTKSYPNDLDDGTPPYFCDGMMEKKHLEKNMLIFSRAAEATESHKPSPHSIFWRWLERNSN